MKAIVLYPSIGTEPDPCNEDTIAYYKFDRSYRDVCFGNNGFSAASSGYFSSKFWEFGISNRAVHFGVNSQIRYGRDENC